MKGAILGVGGCMVLIAGGAFRFVDWDAAWRELADAAEPPQAIHIVTRGPFIVTAPAFGELEAAKSIAVSVPNVRTGGLKIFWIIKDGSRVKKGDTLVEFDATDLLQQLQETEGDVDATLRQMESTVLRGESDAGQIDADVTVAKLERDRAAGQAPMDADLFSRHQILEGKLSVELADTKVAEFTGKMVTRHEINSTSQRILVLDRKRHEAKKGVLQQSLGSLKVLAPYDGLVVHEKDQSGSGVNIGETRWPANVLLRIPQIDSMRGRVYVLESDVGAIKVGQRASLIVDSDPDKQFPATVERVDTLARPRDKDSPVKYFEVILSVDVNGSEVVRPGKQVRAAIVTADYRDAISAPRIAVVEESLKYSVWVQGAKGPEKRAVETAPGDRARVVITSGLSEGERILLDPPRGNRDAAASGSGR